MTNDKPKQIGTLFGRPMYESDILNNVPAPEVLPLTRESAAKFFALLGR